MLRRQSKPRFGSNRTRTDGRGGKKGQFDMRNVNVKKKVEIVASSSSDEDSTESEGEVKVPVNTGQSLPGLNEPHTPAVKAEESNERDEDEEEDEDDDEDDDDGPERMGIRKELANLTFEELEQLKEKMGLTLYNEALFGTKARHKNKVPTAFKRVNKNRPREESAKIRVPRVREVVHVKKIEKRDPRFDSNCGELRQDLWDKNYEFLRGVQQQEATSLKQSLRRETDPEKRKEARKFIQSVKNKEASKVQKKEEERRRKEEREENQKRMKEGKNPFFVKKSTRKLLDLAEKYEKLKQDGKLEKYLKKKRKKNQTRDKKGIVIN